MQQQSESLQTGMPTDEPSVLESPVKVVVSADQAPNKVPDPAVLEAHATITEALGRAVELHREGEFQSAWLIYREILEVVPDHADALHLGGVVAHQIGQSESALLLIRRAIELAPNVADYHSNLGEVLRAQENYEEAEASYRRALREDPEHQNAAGGLVEIAGARARATA